MRYLLTKEQAEILNIIEIYRRNLRLKAMLNEALDEPMVEIKELVNLNNLYGLFFSTLDEVEK
jgi:hypothetical protein